MHTLTHQTSCEQFYEQNRGITGFIDSNSFTTKILKHLSQKHEIFINDYIQSSRNCHGTLQCKLVENDMQ